MARANKSLEQIIEPIVESFELEFWGLEYLPGKRSVLRIYIDNSEGISVNDCEKVSRQVSSVLDVEDPIQGEYVLEVSSPGMDRPLYRLPQYEKFVGSDVSIRLRLPYEGRRKFKGRLMGVEGNEVVVLADEHEYLFPIESIDKANVIPNFQGIKHEAH